jgi:hypothetical protein
MINLLLKCCLQRTAKLKFGFEKGLDIDIGILIKESQDDSISHDET